jgi:hypothetical protein
MKLYKEASLMMLPTSVKDGKLYSIFPQPKPLSGELVTDGGFDNGVSNWNTEGGVDTSVNGGARISSDGSTGSFLQQSNILEIGKIYKVKFDVIQADVVGNLRVGFTTEFSFNNVDVGSYVFYWKKQFTTNFEIVRNGAVDVVIDNISVVEVDQAPADFDFSRGADRATRVTEQGLVQPVEIVGSNVITTGDFDSQADVDFWQIATSSGTPRATKTLVNGFMRLTFDLANGSALFKAGTAVPLGRYKVTFRAKGTVNSNFRSIGDNNSIQDNPEYAISNPTLTSEFQNYEFVIDLTSTSFRLYLASAQVGNTLDIDDIVILPITEATDLPRLDWSGDCPVLLLEPQRTNLVTYSELFSEWTRNSGGTGTQPSLDFGYISPDGSANATKVVFDKGSGNTTSDLSVLQTSFSSVSNTASFYVRSDSSSRLMVRNSSTWEIYDIGTEWTRIEKTDSGGSIQIGLREGYGLSNVPNSSTIYLWGAQVEQGSYATSYIPTRGQAATRAADTTNPTGLDISDFHDGEDFTLFIDLAKNESLIRDSSDGGIRISTQNATASSLRIYRASSNATTNRVVWFDNDSVQLPTPVQILGDSPKVVIRRTYENGEWKVFVNGSVVSTQTNTNYDSMSNVKMWGAGSPQEIKQLTLFDKALSDNECINLTTI